MKAKLFKILTNRYFIVVFLFLIWMLFFDRSRVSEQFSLYKEYQNYLSEKEYYENEIHECNAKIKLLEESQDYIEKIGREKYFLKRDNEVIYYFEKE